ncbi:hypothetical protein L6R52_11310 [Myxococcota bacterium]|nr:hypothetical protein [Myxococcota bacterium]
MTAEDLDRIFTETIARHFSGATISDGVIDLGFAGLRMRCHVPSVQPFGDGASASLFMNLWGGALGDQPIFVSISGYGDDATSAVVVGGCNWACTFGPVLRAGLGEELVPDAEHVSVTAHGRTWDVWTGGLDRVLGTAPLTADVHEHARRARTRLTGKRWLTERVLESPWLPVLDPEGPTLLSVFVGDAPERRIVEVKVGGADWPMAARAFGDSPAAPGPETMFLRELSVVVPSGAHGGLRRAELERTLEGLALPIEGGRASIAWPGWAAHRGELLAPLSEEEVTRVEADVGPLPAD